MPGRNDSESALKAMRCAAKREGADSGDEDGHGQEAGGDEHLLQSGWDADLEDAPRQGQIRSPAVTSANRDAVDAAIQDDHEDQETDGAGDEGSPGAADRAEFG